MSNLDRFIIWERPSVPNFVYIAAEAVVKPHQKQFGVPWGRTYCFFSDAMIRVLWHKDEFVKNGVIVTKKFLSKEYFNKKIKIYERLTRNLFFWFFEVEKSDLISLSDQKFLKLVEDYNKSFLNWWGFAQVAEMISLGAESLLKQVRDISQEQMSLLTTPTRKSYTIQEEESVFKITQTVISNRALRKIFIHSTSQIIHALTVNYPKIYQQLKRHQLKYFWTMNSYLETRYLDLNYFIERIREALQGGITTKDIGRIIENNKERLKEFKASKARIIKDLKLSPQEKRLVWLVDYFAYFQDLRKADSLLAHHYIGLFIEEMARRSGWNEEMIKFLIPREYANVLSKKLLLSKVKQRLKHFSLVFTLRGLEILSGNPSFKREQNIVGDKVKKEVTEFEGMRAMGGKLVGRVRKILHPNEIVEMKREEILVTTMTSPDFVVAMKKAKAIITDEGGITCHAAVISRELGIPCVIGTKIATRVLKTGDQVEVNANHGIIKILRE